MTTATKKKATAKKKATTSKKKSQKRDSKVDPSNRKAVIAALEKKYPNTSFMGNEIDDPDRIPFSSLGLNKITGGGIPQGRWTRLYGGFSSGKTRNAYDLIMQAQKLGMECVYYNVEKQYTPTAAASAGIDISKLTVLDCSTIEIVGEMLESMLGVAQFHVIDSCSNAVSVDELEADLTSWRPGLMARAWGKVLRRAHERMDTTDNSVVLIDQMRSTIGGKGKGDNEAPPGGKFMDFLSSSNLNFRRGKWLFRDRHGNLVEKLSKSDTQEKSMSGSMEPQGREIKVRCEKSRVGRPELAATLHFDQDNYIFDYEWEYLNALKFHKMVEQSGSWYEYEFEDGSTKNCQGEQGLRELLREYPDLKLEVEKAVLLS